MCVSICRVTRKVLDRTKWQAEISTVNQVTWYGSSCESDPRVLERLFPECPVTPDGITTEVVKTTRNSELPYQKVATYVSIRYRGGYHLDNSPEKRPRVVLIVNASNPTREYHNDQPSNAFCRSRSPNSNGCIAVPQYIHEQTCSLAKCRRTRSNLG